MTELPKRENRGRTVRISTAFRIVYVVAAILAFLHDLVLGGDLLLGAVTGCFHAGIIYLGMDLIYYFVCLWLRQRMSPAREELSLRKGSQT